ncbi:unnamed protein product [Caenorhabditis auriculariae]|uniref:Uncharacterized protein n=1 Tax=Caenorhabditis auriculariae TaxID=2777116 RepID=A0A8S1HFV8_9PELO|nr:unnamed protein product [Caenorhabditis auriculariae]
MKLTRDVGSAKRFSVNGLGTGLPPNNETATDKEFGTSEMDQHTGQGQQNERRRRTSPSSESSLRGEDTFKLPLRDDQAAELAEFLKRNRELAGTARNCYEVTVRTDQFGATVFEMTLVPTGNNLETAMVAAGEDAVERRRDEVESDSFQLPADDPIVLSSPLNAPTGSNFASGIKYRKRKQGESPSVPPTKKFLAGPAQWAAAKRPSESGEESGPAPKRTAEDPVNSNVRLGGETRGDQDGDHPEDHADRGEITDESSPSPLFYSGVEDEVDWELEAMFPSVFSEAEEDESDEIVPETDDQQQGEDVGPPQLFYSGVEDEVDWELEAMFPSVFSDEEMVVDWSEDPVQGRDGDEAQPAVPAAAVGGPPPSPPAPPAAAPAGPAQAGALPPAAAPAPGPVRLRQPRQRRARIFGPAQRASGRLRQVPVAPRAHTMLPDLERKSPAELLAEIRQELRRRASQEMEEDELNLTTRLGAAITTLKGFVAGSFTAAQMQKLRRKIAHAF